MPPRKLRVGALQSDIAWENPPANFAKLQRWIETAEAAGVQLLVLPEMFACGFSMNTHHIQEPPAGPSESFLFDRARAHGLWICGSVPILAEGAERPHNTLVFAGPEGQRHAYRKIHPFTYAREHEHYAAGDAFTTFEIDGVRVTGFICYDLRFADEFWACANDTDLYVVVANWPMTRRAHWSALLESRAIENQAYVVGCNRVGQGGKLEYSGDSAIIGPMGETLSKATMGETLLIADVDAGTVDETRERFPFLRDRR